MAKAIKRNPDNPVLTAALRYAEQSLPVFPCANEPNNLERHKSPLTKHGFKDATTSPTTIRAWWGRWPNALIGMPTGKITGIAVLDLDNKNGKDGFAAVPDWQQRTPVIARTPSSGAHLYFKNADGLYCSDSKIAPGVDTRADGGYAIVPPSAGYIWVNDAGFSALPPWPDDLRLPERNRAERTTNGRPEAEIALVAAALAVIPNDDLGWSDWNRIGMATWRGTNGSDDGLAAFMAWSKKSKKFDADITAKRWQHYFTSPPDQIGAGTLFHEADQALPGWRWKRHFDPGAEGPIPLGFTKEGSYAFRDRIRNIIVIQTSNQLLSPQSLLGLMPSSFWMERFPSKKGFNSFAAGESLMMACRRIGPFNPLRVRGRGIWREGDEIIINLGGAIPPTAQNHYVCFEPVEFNATAEFEVQRLLDCLRLFPWRNPQDAMLLLGWLALAPICGVLAWRPHAFIFGPPETGKTTLHLLAKRLLTPLVISADGQSSEAGIRQTLGPDSLPVILDEFESDQHGAGLRAVLRLARSASSADNPVLRGTPEGKAMQFSLRTTFLWCAVNCTGMSPADRSRVLLFELMKHDKSKDIAQRIAEEEGCFQHQGPRWCSYMIARAELVQPALEAFQLTMPDADRHYRQNFATLMAGAFIALHGRLPTADEVDEWAEEYAPAMTRHKQDAERDNSIECLNQLWAHIVDRYPLGHWIATLHDCPDNQNHVQDAERIAYSHGITIREVEGKEVVLIRNRSPNIEAIYSRTAWAGGGWQRALRALNGAFSPENPMRFPGGGKERCVAIPVDYVPEPLDISTGETPRY